MPEVPEWRRVELDSSSSDDDAERKVPQPKGAAARSPASGAGLGTPSSVQRAPSFTLPPTVEELLGGAAGGDGVPPGPVLARIIARAEVAKPVPGRPGPTSGHGADGPTGGAPKGARGRRDSAGGEGAWRASHAPPSSTHSRRLSSFIKQRGVPAASPMRGSASPSVGSAQTPRSPGSPGFAFPADPSRSRSASPMIVGGPLGAAGSGATGSPQSASGVRWEGSGRSGSPLPPPSPAASAAAAFAMAAAGSSDARHAGMPMSPTRMRIQRQRQTSSALRSITSGAMTAVVAVRLRKFAKNAAVAETASLGGDVGVAARAQEAALAHMVAGLPSSRRPRLVHPVAMYDAARYKSLRGREPNPAVGPLRRLFDTYARLFSAGAQLASMGKDALTYDMRAYARKTMSRGELLFLLRDIEVVPQLASRTEVEWVFDRRTHPVKMPHTSIRARPGAGLRAVAELAAGKPAAGEAEEDDVDAAGGGATSSHGPIAGMDPSAAAAAIDAAVSRDPIVEELGWTLDDATVETQLRQGDLDFRRFCRILVRVALFAMSKPSIALSGLGMPSHARLPSGRARLARPPGDDAIPLPREEDDLLLLPQPSDPIDPVTTRAAPQARQALAALGLTPALAARRATASPAAKLRRFLRHTRLVSPSHVSNILNTVARETDDLLNAPGPPPSDMDRASYLPQQSGAVVDAKRAVAALHARRTRLANARGALLPDGEGRLVDSQWRGGASASSVGAIAVTLSRQVPPPTSGTGASAPGPSLASLPAGHRTLPGLAGARGSAPLGAAAEAGVLAEVVDRDRPGRAAALRHPQVEADTSSSDDDDGFADVDPEQRFDGQDPNAKRWTYYAPAVGETFMDFGRVLVGKRYGFRIEVRNVSGDTLRVHAAKRGLPGLKLRYRARPAAAGMTILLDMQLQARQPLEAIGHVVVTATAGTREERLVCPCYVRAVEPGSVAARLADLPPAQGVVPLGVDGRADGAGEDSSSDGGAALDALGTAMPDSPGGGGGGFRPQ
ncbi:hypothetical protein FNF28_05709 [Cafeteria roenbergensis]|uniref:Uncharacterized protein n=1 Tax=Cafeteria roenbergensis TaxID=33653 RepID=A0A5A8D336_CAFRO|nr:hypothetical protein FNF28_05709 [Cafeteria roenbergensis]